MRGFLFLCLTGSLLGQVTPTTTTSTTTTAKPKTAATSGTTTAKPKTATTAAKSTTTTAPAKPKATATTATTAAKPKAASPAALATDTDKTIYALGLVMARNLGQFDLSPAELEIIERAITDAAAGKPAIQIDEWGPKIQGLAKERQGRVAAQQKLTSQPYLAKAAAEPGAVRTASGLIYREERPGTGRFPLATDTVKVNYRGTLTDGTEFDSSYKRNEPASFPLNHVIKCWTEGLQKMKVGGKAVLVCPAELAYGDQPPPGIPPGSTLIFDVELLEIGGAAK
jgi:FKBP-type peptidyl-prolyl cis-trans isomerase FkpA